MPVLQNPKHERFAQELVKGKTADEAYQLAGYAANRGNAGALKAKQHIIDRTAEILGAAAKRSVVTIDTIAEMLKEDRAKARLENQMAAAVRATESLGRLYGYYVERKDIRVLNFRELTDEQIDAFIAEHGQPEEAEGARKRISN